MRWSSASTATPGARRRGERSTPPGSTDGGDVPACRRRRPDDYVRKHGKAAFETLLREATSLSAFLLRELAAAHPPTSAEGRAALVAAARPHVAALNAPVSRCLRQELAALTGSPEADCARCCRRRPESRRRRLPSPAGRAPNPGESGGPRHRLAACAVARPRTDPGIAVRQAARTITIPQPDDGDTGRRGPGGTGRLLPGRGRLLSTPGTMQHFAGTAHERVLVSALSSAHGNGVTPGRRRIAPACRGPPLLAGTRSATASGSRPKPRESAADVPPRRRKRCSSSSTSGSTWPSGRRRMARRPPVRGAPRDII